MASSGKGVIGPQDPSEQPQLVALLSQHGPLVRQRLEGRIPRRWQSLLSIDDVMQQTYTDAFLFADRLRSGDSDSFSPWLLAVAKSNLIDALRMLQAEKRGRNHRRVNAFVGEESFVALYEHVAATDTTPSRHAARNEVCAAVEWALLQLPEQYRLVVRMYDLEGRPMIEIAHLLQRSVGAAHMLRKRAHDRLRELMGNATRYFSNG